MADSQVSLSKPSSASPMWYNNIFIITCYGIRYALYARSVLAAEGRLQFSRLRCIPYSGRDVPGGQSSLIWWDFIILIWSASSATPSSRQAPRPIHSTVSVWYIYIYMYTSIYLYIYYINIYTHYMYTATPHETKSRNASTRRPTCCASAQG